MVDLEPFRLPLAPIPEPARHVLERGIAQQEFPDPEQAQSVLIDRRSRYPDGVRRAADGKALVLCTTDMPGVTPAMIDWWFGWHLPDSARYRLWHPTAHLKTRVKEDRSHLAEARARYVGNVSYVDEYIGKSLERLAIAFEEPANFGLTDLDARGATAICARTAKRRLASEGGCLVHLVLPTDQGCEMRSAFWLGEFRNRLPVVGKLVTGLVNRRALRERIIGDGFLLDLFQHCAEEMNHLAKVLPRAFAALR